MISTLMFIVGTIAGSVANALVYRLPRGMSWWHGRSRCPDCKHELSWKDLIPVISYIYLGGKCRYCHRSIPWRYLWVELFLGITFSLSPLSILGILWITTVIAIIDWETMLVSDWLVLIWAGLVIVSGGTSILGGLVGMGVIGGIWVVTKKKAMGSGDIGIAAVLGLWLGWPKIITGLWFAFVLGGIYGVFLLVRGKASLKTAVPFGPFLILGGWIAYTLTHGIFSF